jgi:hypothetical protein
LYVDHQRALQCVRVCGVWSGGGRQKQGHAANDDYRNGYKPHHACNYHTNNDATYERKKQGTTANGY